MFNKVFGSFYWRVVVVFVLTFLFFGLGYLVLTAHYSLSLSQALAGTQQIEFFRGVYVWGIVAFVLSLMILLAGLWDLFTIGQRNQKFREIGRHYMTSCAHSARFS